MKLGNSLPSSSRKMNYLMIRNLINERVNKAIKERKENMKKIFVLSLIFLGSLTNVVKSK